jgi:FMN phosphatase YigB (HAD superfamily)
VCKKKLVIFIDSGDTIIDEGTQIRDDTGSITSAECLPGAAETIRKLAKNGYTLCLVADGEAQSFKNMMKQHNIYDCFSSMIISENIKAEKPSPRMFKAAMGALELTDSDIPRIIMVGNNLSRDIKGANLMGIRSVHIRWTPRYNKVPKDETEIATYTINLPEELLELSERLEKMMQ